jgi:hypothetical protein
MASDGCGVILPGPGWLGRGVLERGEVELRSTKVAGATDIRPFTLEIPEVRSLRQEGSSS